MTHKKFIIEIEKYYGKYERKETREAVYIYIKNHYITEKFLGKLYKQILVSYSGQYHYPPDICIIEKAAKEIARDDYAEVTFRIPADEPDKNQQQRVAELFLDLFEKYKEHPEVQRILAKRREEQREAREKEDKVPESQD